MSVYVFYIFMYKCIHYINIYASHTAAPVIEK